MSMVIQTQMSIPHWTYLLAIERDLGDISRYIEFDTRNFDCFSIELSKVLLSAGAETDVVCKQLCKKVNNNSRADSIGDYRTELTKVFPSISNFGVNLPRFGMKLTPWDEWKKRGGVPLWWNGYNKVKHHRHTHYHSASLKNALNAVTGLFVMVLYLYKEEAESGKLTPRPQLLTVEESHDGGEEIGGSWEYYYRL
jgi:hypothetical protein